MIGFAAPFAIAEREYEHFSFDAQARENAVWLILALCAGVLLAACVICYQQLTCGKLVRALIAAGAFVPKTALTLASLGCDTAAVRGELKRNAMLRRLTDSVTDPDGTVRFFLPEDKKYAAEARFDRKGNGVAALLVTAALTALAAFLIIRLLPAFLSAIDRIM